MLVSDFMVNSKLKIFNGISMESMESLHEDVQKEKEKGHILYIGVRAILIATSANFLDTKYEFFGFNDDLRDTIN